MSKSKRRKSSDDSGQQQQSNLLKSESRKEMAAAPTTGTQAALPIPRAPSIFTFDSNSAQPRHNKPLPPAAIFASSSSSSPPSSSDGVQDNRGGTLTHSGSTLDDLCRAAAELERMDTDVSVKEKVLMKEGDSGEQQQQQQQQDDDEGRRRPGNISIPQTQSPSMAIERERHRLGATPPYTPPPILSPSRSLIHLAPSVGGQGNCSNPCTPNRILQHWSGWKGGDGRKMSETEDAGFSEPRINIGVEFQAKLPVCDGT